MLKKIPFYIKTILLSGTAGLSLLVAGAEITDNSLQVIRSAPENLTALLSDSYESNLSRYSGYSPDDWGKYILAPGYDLDSESSLISDDEINMLFYGSMNLNMLYGKSFFTDKKYKQFDEDKPVSRVISEGFMPEQLLLLHMEGTVGRRLTVYIDHDSRRQDNRYLIQYRAVRDDEVIREINAGEIDVQFKHSKYAVFESSTSKGMGVDALFKKDKLSVKTFGSISRGDLEVEIFNGNSSPGSVKLSEYQYIKRTWYQLEPYRRYDGLTAPPSAGDNPYAELRVFNSNDPTFVPGEVGINPAGFELYIDDQNPYNNNGGVTLSSVDGGSYVRLRNGTDYSINYSTGLIRFIRNISENARIFALYSLSSGISSDPAVRNDLFPGRNFVFIKYGPSIHEDHNYNFNPDSGEDRNGDQRLNLDIYEVRSFYYCGEKNISPDSFKATFFRENTQLSLSEKYAIGKWNVDYTEGILQFSIREPFRQSIEEKRRGKIYSEIQSKNAYDYSRFFIKIDYKREARTFHLKRINIIPGSEIIKVNRRELSESHYSLDYTGGFLSFNDPNNPVITPDTEIEIRYEYMPFEGQKGGFSGGLRTDYAVNKDINVGGTILYSGSSAGQYIPLAGSEGSDTVMLEGDVAMRFSRERLSSAYSRLTGSRASIPAEVKISGELAKSWKGINAFGKALIDNMESAEEIISLSTSEKDWILSSRPDGVSSRSILNYMFYRELSEPENLQGISFNARSVQYQVKPGPYNIAFGHIPDSIEKQRAQRSIVLDFDGDGDFISIVTRQFSRGTPVDMSGLQYAEISYYYDGSGSADLYFDLGSINEDSDSDGVLDTEDLNRNGYLDGGPNTSVHEDRGYRFNESGHTATIVGSGPGFNTMTSGDGVLNTEDLNGNGILDITESVFTMPSSHTSPSAFSISPGSGWRKLRIYINQSADREILRRVESIRLYAKKSSGISGRIFIDDMKFVTTKWKEPEINNTAAEPDQLRLTMVNTLNDSDYKNDSFLSSNKELYKKLYGEKSDYDLDIETESALQIDYGNGSAGDIYSVVRRFPRSIDLRHYKKMNLWINYRQFNPGDSVTVHLASSDSDYFEFTWNMDHQKSWREITLNLNNNKDRFSIYSIRTTGVPDMKRIVFMKLIITSSGASGRLWLNEIYVSAPEVFEDYAHWYETQVTFEKPFHVTKGGVPILSDMNIKYIKRGHGGDFSSIRKQNLEISEDSHEISSSMKILPYWGAVFNYTAEISESDPLDYNIPENKRGRTSRSVLIASTDYLSPFNPIPTVRALYKYESRQMSGTRPIGLLPVNVNSEKEVHSPAFEVSQIFDSFLWGKGTLKGSLDMTFTDENISRSADGIDDADFESLTRPEEARMIQRSSSKAGFMYEHELFYLYPEISLSSEETVRSEGADLSETGISSRINGGYHFPFIYDEDFRFMERSRGIAFKTGSRGKRVISPELSARFYSNENRFQDITEEAGAGNYSRVRDTKYHASSSLNLPVNLSTIRSLNNIKSLSLSYSRNIYFNESSVPYEGESTGSLEEEFGIQRVFSGVAGSAFDLFRYYPGFFFTGRENFGEGRDAGRKILNSEININRDRTYGDYNNNIRITENFSFNTMHEYRHFTLYGGGSFYQAADRQNIYGIPVQIVSMNSNGNLNFDLMKMFNFWFFRPNGHGLPHHSSYLETGYSYTENMLVTANTEEKVHSPSIGLMFKWDRSLLSFKTRVDIRLRNDQEYIAYEYNKRNRADDVYINKMPEYFRFHEINSGYNFSILYETDVHWIYNYFSDFYKLAAMPLFSVEYSMNINRYDYLASVSPESYDLYMLLMKLTLDLHKNIQGGISSRLALEHFRERTNEEIKTGIFSFETGFHFSLIF